MNDDGRTLHARLVAGDPVAPAELAERYLDILVVRVAGAYPGLDDDLYGDAAETALVSLIKNPVSYDPQRSSLENYLALSARRDLLNLVRSRQRQQGAASGFSVVELSVESTETIADDDPGVDPAAVLERADDDRPPGWLQEITAVWTYQEREFLDLMQENERRTSRYAEVLCIADLAPAEQRAEVKRMKDRLTRRIQRAVARGHVVEA